MHTQIYTPKKEFFQKTNKIEWLPNNWCLFYETSQRGVDKIKSRTKQTTSSTTTTVERAFEKMADYHSNCWTTGQSVACTHKVNGICLYQITNIRELGKLCVCLTKEAKHARTNPTPRAEWSSFHWKITHLSSGGATVATQGHEAGAEPIQRHLWRHIQPQPITLLL